MIQKCQISSAQYIVLNLSKDRHVRGVEIKIKKSKIK
jgi:hypothetical protein